ncbi:endonuclease NucS domain-containing protein, partial [Vibrio parahaemolyticus]
MKESEIRDILAEKICVLEEGLTLQKKEQYIPNELGTRGFIDLYARDVEGNHVLIELKRSKPATR